jgi:hypothetical protein
MSDATSAVEVVLWARRLIARRRSAPHELLGVAPEASLEELSAAFHRIARVAHPDLHRSAMFPEDLELVTSAYARVAAGYATLRAERLRAPSDSRPPPTTGATLPPMPGGTGTIPPATARVTTPPPSARVTTPPPSARVTTPPTNAGRPITGPYPTGRPITGALPSQRPTTGAVPTIGRTVSGERPVVGRTATVAPKTTAAPTTTAAPATTASRPTTGPIPVVAGRTPTPGPPTSGRTPTGNPPLLSRTSTGEKAPLLERAPVAQAMAPRAIIYFRKAELALRQGDLRGGLLHLRLAIGADPQNTALRQALAEVEAEVNRGK